ncbi:MAG: DUF6159 family protein [Actinomycetota bacterium]
MFGALDRSWELVKESWGVLREDRELMVFPVLSGIATLLVSASFLIPIALSIPWDDLRLGVGNDVEFRFGPLHYGLSFLYYLVSYFVVVFFNAGLVACVRKRFQGEKPTVADGINFSCRNLGVLFQWAVFSATVGTVLRAIEERANWLGSLAAGIVGVVWSIATLFVVPVLVYEGVGPVQAVRRSALAFRKTWGEAVVVNFGLNTVFGLLLLPSILVLLAGFYAFVTLAQTDMTRGAVVFGSVVSVCAVYWLGLAIVQSSLQGIFLTACYEYATTGKAPAAFSDQHISGAWRPRNK